MTCIADYSTKNASSQHNTGVPNVRHYSGTPADAAVKTLRLVDVGTATMLLNILPRA
ncbi:MAG: hypothetical protein ABL931_17985 [Usitatibacteraceae bacterium]